MNPHDPSVNIPGFQMFISPYHFCPDIRSQSFLPGSCMFISNVLTVYGPSVCIEIENSCQLLNVTCCLVCCRHSYLAVACIYRSPSTSIADCLVELRNVFSDLLTLTKHIVIVGDFNINLLSSLTSSVASDADLLSDFQFTQYVTAPSRVTNCSATLIDHLLVTPSLSVSQSYQTVDLSDHRCQILEVDIPVVRPAVNYVSVRSFRKCPWDEVRHSLSTAPWHVMDNHDDVDDMWHFFVSILYHCLDMYAPSHTVPIKHSHRPTPWISPDLLTAIKHKLRAKRRAESTGSDADISYYKQLKNRLKVLVCEAKISYLNQLLLRSKKDPQHSAELWLGINNILGQYHFRQNSIDATLSLNDINSFFCTAAITPDHCPATCFDATASTDLPVDRFQFSMISESLVLLLLSHLDVRKSVGQDGLSARFLKEVAEQIVIPLTKIYNKSLKSGVITQSWKCSNVTPVHKRGPCNFQPISVVSIAAKLLEKVVSNQLYSFLESNELLSPCKGAYRRSKSTEQLLLVASDTIAQVLDSGGSSCIAFSRLTIVSREAKKKQQ